MNMKKILLISAVAAPAIFAATAYQNQVGFMTNGLKQIAVVDAAGKDVVFKDKDGNAALTVKAPEASMWKPANEEASLVDFSELKTPGTYQAYVGDEAVGHPIVIADNALEDVTKASIKFFYFQRSSTALEEEYAGKYARAMGTPDTAVMYHESTGKEDLTATFNGAKGWYDAGDYGKYIVNSGISTYTLLQLYQQNKAYFDTLNLNIPESKNNVPDLLDEIRWNIEWMLTMQDDDGGVFHKLTTKQFAGMVLPEKSTKQRYAIGKSVTATWDFVGVTALAADIYKPFDPEFAEKCAKAAADARWWARNNPYAFFTQPSDVGTGSYTDGNAVDEQIWGATELYRISQKPEFLEDMHQFLLTKTRRKLQGWQTVYALAAFTIATNPQIFDEADVDSAKILIFTLADSYIEQMNNGYGLAIDNSDFYWGSNSVVANKGMVLVHAYILTKEQKYLDAAQGIADYLLGRNPLDLSYLTGWGVNQVKDPHHRPSQGDTVEAPVPGMLVGGPNSSADDCAKKTIDKDAPAKSYYDNHCSYATNEVAINWNAPFAYLLGSLQAITATGKVYEIGSDTPEKYDVDKIPLAKTNFSKQAEGSRLVFKNGVVQVERTLRDGTVRYFNLRGRNLK